MFVRQGLWSALGQFLLMAAGVYLGIQADQWRENREHRRAARATLVDFRTELLRNRENLALRRPIWTAYADSIAASRGRGDPPPRSVDEAFGRLGWRGLAPVRFERTAWELALATQALDHVPRDVAFRVARLYDAQAQLVEYQATAGSALFSPEAFADERVRAWLMIFTAFAVDSRQMSAQLDSGMVRILGALDSTIARLPR